MDTSVFGGFFEPEFELWTKLLIDKIIKGEEWRILLCGWLNFEDIECRTGNDIILQGLLIQDIEYCSIGIYSIAAAPKYHRIS